MEVKKIKPGRQLVSNVYGYFPPNLWYRKIKVYNIRLYPEHIETLKKVFIE